MPKDNVVIKIKVKKDGISLKNKDHEDVHINANDTLRWERNDKNDDLRFEIEFDDKTPFDKKKFSFDEAGQARGHRPDCERAGTPYKYTIYEEGNRDNKLDPRVIIDDPT